MPPTNVEKPRKPQLSFEIVEQQKETQHVHQHTLENIRKIIIAGYNIKRVGEYLICLEVAEDFVNKQRDFCRHTGPPWRKAGNA